MDSIKMREKLHHYLDVGDDEKIKAFYTLVKDDMTESTSYSDEFKTLLDQRFESYKKNPSHVIDAEESKKRIQSLMDHHSQK